MKNNNHKPLESQTAIVTGASSGIGQAVAIELGASGANVLINYHRDEEGAQKTLETIERVGGRGIVLQGDVGKQEDISLMFEEVKKNFGNLHILVSNAGIQKDKAFTEMELEEWDLVIKTNLYGAFLSSQMAARAFMDQGVNEHISKAAGKIVFISSVHDIIPWAGRVNYTSSKGGLKMMMESIAQELAPHRIRVNNVSPGAIKTSINEEEWGDEQGLKKMLSQIPYGRVGDPEDIAKAVRWLVTDEADYITGTTIYVDGGMTLYPSFGPTSK
jgi:glucose 1-dehydrogenase